MENVLDRKYAWLKEDYKVQLIIYTQEIVKWLLIVGRGLIIKNR